MAKIPFALDPHGNEVHISDADDQKPREYYTCPDCGGPLQTRKGTSYQHYFAHYPGVLDEHDCSLGTPDAIRKLTEEKRTSDRERTYNQHTISIGLRIQYGIVELIGILPTLDWDNLEPNTSPDEVLRHLSISGVNIQGSLQRSNFHPNEAEATVTLEQDATEYILQIQSNDTPALEDLAGKWHAEGIEPGDVFVGDQTRAHRVQGTVKPSAGDWVGIVTRGDPADPRNEVDVYEVGDNYLVGFQYHDEQGILTDYLGEEMVQQERFSADLVLPPRCTPNTEAPQAIMDEEELLVGITPAPKTDPEFEIVPFPRNAGSVDRLDALGEGTVRFWGRSFTETGSLKVTVHRPNTNEHRLLQFEPVDTVNYPHWGSEPKLLLTVQTQDGTHELDPVTGPTDVTVSQTPDADMFTDNLEFQSPENYRFDLQTELGISDGFSTVRRQNKTLAEARSTIRNAIKEGCEQLQFRLNGLQNLTISFENESSPDLGPVTKSGMDTPDENSSEKLSDKIVKQQIQNMNPLPDKAQWQVVREVYNIPAGMSNATLHYRAKKQVSRILREVHEERQGDGGT